MYYTYVILCTKSKLKTSRLYIGSTSNLKRRITEHKNGGVETTRRFDTLELVYFEACRNKTDAIKRELQLKTGFGRGYIKKRLMNDFI